MLTLQTRQWQHWRVFFWGERATSVHIVDRSPTTTHIASAHSPPFMVTKQTRRHWHMNGARPPMPRHHCKRHGAPGSACVWDTRPSMALLTHSGAPPPEGYVEPIQRRGPLKHQDILYLSVASRTIIWSLVKQMRVCLIPLFHRLHRCTALER